MIDIKQEKERLISANRLLVKARWFYTMTLLVTGYSAKFLGGIEDTANQNFSSLFMLSIALGGGFGVNFVYYIFFRNAHKRSLASVKIMSIVQLLGDIISITVIILFAGGIISISFFYFTFAIIASGIFYGWGGILAITTIASILYGGIIWGQYFDIIPYLPRYNHPFEFELAHNIAAVFPNTFTTITTFLMIGIFVGNFARNIRQKEEAILKEKDKEEAIISNLLSGLIYLNENGQIDMVNSQAERLLEFKAGNVLGKTAKELGQSEHPLMYQLFNKTKSTGEIVPVGKPDAVYDIDTIEIKDHDKKVIGTTKLIHDISREKYMEKMKSEFITIAGHQLRTPLSAVKGAVDLILSGAYKEQKERDQIMKEIYKYNNRMITLVDDLLNASSVEEGRYDYKYKNIDIQSILDGLSSQFQGEAKDKAISFNIQIENNLSTVELDEYKIKLSLITVISNAFTYTALGGKINIRVKFPSDKKVIIEIRDNGIGIPSHQHDKIFSKFFRAENALKYQTEGNGLDLFVAKNIIENHNGRIWFDSEEGFGTTFYIELPTKQPNIKSKNVK